VAVVLEVSGAAAVDSAVGGPLGVGRIVPQKCHN